MAAEPALGRDAAYGHCAALVREQDRDRYWSALLAPADKRPHLFALYAFSAEVARVRDAISAPMPGEIRLQWWRDAVEGLGRGDVGANPVAAALEDTIGRFALPRQALVDLIDARVFDLYDDPMPSVGDLEGYLGETSSALIRLASLVLADGQDPGGAEAAGHAGVAYGLTGLLRALPWQARQGRLYLPADILQRHGATRDDVVRGRGGPGVLAALAEMRMLARTHHARFAELRPDLPPAIRTAFLPAALVPGDLAALERAPDPLASSPERPAWRRLASMWWAARG
ncbi:phytoene/squalene synthase family protein [Enterovirga sp.]|uniref:phytoene/squalene synthase family protein n=1 Tax=Enterovirga sp. TaxID=2026350 RepID=UPI002619AEA9|nr:phytoene/squalene synthase family protein [Enterovirga sp.]MDB5591897.1 Squalene/phytoene synthase [Enterovirga sp.]